MFLLVILDILLPIRNQIAAVAEIEIVALQALPSDSHNGLTASVAISIVNNLFYWII